MLGRDGTYARHILPVMQRPTNLPGRSQTLVVDTEDFQSAEVIQNNPRNPLWHWQHRIVRPSPVALNAIAPAAAGPRPVVNFDAKTGYEASRRRYLARVGEPVHAADASLVLPRPMPDALYRGSDVGARTIDLYSAYHLRMYPTRAQKAQLHRTFEAARFCYNGAAAVWRGTGMQPGCTEMETWLTTRKYMANDGEFHLVRPRRRRGKRRRKRGQPWRKPRFPLSTEEPGVKLDATQRDALQQQRFALMQRYPRPALWMLDVSPHTRGHGGSP